MLVALTVEDLGLIERAELELGPGLQVITGETGVGKSMLLISLALLRGDRPNADLIRSGCAEARVSGLFHIEDPGLRDRLAATSGAEIEEGEFLVERFLVREGRHRTRWNGREVPASFLREAGAHLIEIHGQQSQWRLLDARAQLEAVDRFVGITAERAEYSTLFRRTRALEAHIAAMRTDAAARAEQRRSLEDRLAELDAVDPRPGERDRLEEELRLLGAGDEIGQAIAATIERFRESDDSLLDVLGSTAREFEALGAHHRELAEFGAACAEAASRLGDALRSLSGLADTLDLDPGALERLGRRFDKLVELEERYRRRGDDLVRHREELRAELAALAGAEEGLPRLAEELSAAIEDLGSRARTLTRRRGRGLRELSARITAELADLGMERATFEAQRRPLAAGAWGGLDETGADRIEWIFGPNPGEPARPLGEIASGGELSRVVLSLKRTLAEVATVPTLVFDEIDAGVGGRLGDALGAKLREIGARHQVLCVTHLPQLACYGDRHLRVEKEVVGERTVTRVVRLEGERRVEEIAAMMRGTARTERSLAEARDMLESARARAEARPGERAC